MAVKFPFLEKAAEAVKSVPASVVKSSEAVAHAAPTSAVAKAATAVVDAPKKVFVSAAEEAAHAWNEAALKADQLAKKV